MRTPTELSIFADNLRDNRTQAEIIFAKKLDKADIVYDEQEVIGFFICDFLIHDSALVVEIDGNIHDLKDQVEYDTTREKKLKEWGFKYLRIRNDQVNRFDIDVIKDMGSVSADDLFASLGKAYQEHLDMFLKSKRDEKKCWLKTVDKYDELLDAFDKIEEKGFSKERMAEVYRSLVSMMVVLKDLYGSSDTEF